MAIKDWPLEDRPCEKLLKCGPKALTDAELIAIFLRTGIRGKTALDISKELLITHGGLRNLFDSSCLAIAQTKGIGPIKYAMLQAALELGKRYSNEPILQGELFASSQHVERFLGTQLQDYRHEVFACLFLDVNLRLIRFEELFHGTLQEAAVYPREIVKRSIALHAAKVILAHNHPSGDPHPSQADKELTQHIKQALALVDIVVIDHIIVGYRGSFSFAEQGLL